MTFDGEVQEYLSEVPMGGHNRPPADPPFSALKRLAMIREALMDGGLSKDQALAQIAYWTISDARGELAASIETWCMILRSTNRKRVRGVRDSLLEHSFEEVDRKNGAKTFRTTVSEEDISAAVKVYRQGVSDSTPNATKGVSNDTSPQVSDDTPTGTNGYPQEVSADTPKQVSNDTPASRVRVSYTGNIKNIPLPRACEDWRSFVLVDGNLGITDRGLKFWMDRGMDEARIDLALLEADGKLSDYDRKTADGVEKKAGLFFSRNLQERLDRDKRYEAACARKEGSNQKRRPAGSKEALELLRKQKERGER